ncbi:large ribosomal subunit protein uL1m isoform X2 [Lepisosteus oculatus]|uniref:large ribosomal subunit protein uL1m isoform X2 n=1 Tax=Lepisosteus oculatus TaxID=7918 RepID=UPI0007401878|nr:PREDICTED: 39S ribosomal protein L1, mitochondrial isoform X2 [Lepisosteus oculatus]
MNMASYARIAGKVLSGCQRHLPTTCGQRFTRVLQFPQRQFSVKTHAAVKYTKNKQKDDKPKEERERRTENINRHKPFGLTAWKPVDDVYVTRFYPKTVFEVNAAIDMLKRFQELDFTYPKQPLYLDLKLDVKLEKKKKVDPFVSTVHLPHPFKTEVNRVLVFTENTEEVKIAQKSGAAFVGGAELVQKIMDDEVQADFYIAVPAILPKLLPLKNKLRKKFPKSKRAISRSLRKQHSTR